MPSLLDKYLSKSDGIYTEDLMTISDEIFNLDAKSLLIYLVKNDALNLKAALIKIWSEKLSVYEGERREQELKKFKKKELERVINLGINDEEKKFLIKMLDEIDPSSFD